MSCACDVQNRTNHPTEQQNGLRPCGLRSAVDGFHDTASPHQREYPLTLFAAVLCKKFDLKQHIYKDWQDGPEDDTIQNRALQLLLAQGH